MPKTTRAYVKILEVIGEPTSRYEEKAKEVRICARDDLLRESGMSWRFIKDLMQMK